MPIEYKNTVLDGHFPRKEQTMAISVPVPKDLSGIKTKVAAIAKELKARRLSAAKIHLAVGLPLKWVQAQRDSFREYMMQNRHIDYKYASKHYEVDIVDCTVMPQCYAAIAENLPDFKGMHMIADIGNGTMNVMILNNGKASESKSWTVKLGGGK